MEDFIQQSTVGLLLDIENVKMLEETINKTKALPGAADINVKNEPHHG